MATERSVSTRLKDSRELGAAKAVVPCAASSTAHWPSDPSDSSVHLTGSRSGSSFAVIQSYIPTSTGESKLRTRSPLLKSNHFGRELANEDGEQLPARHACVNKSGQEWGEISHGFGVAESISASPDLVVDLVVHVVNRFARRVVAARVARNCPGDERTCFNPAGSVHHVRRQLRDIALQQVATRHVHRTECGMHTPHRGNTTSGNQMQPTGAVSAPDGE